MLCDMGGTYIRVAVVNSKGVIDEETVMDIGIAAMPLTVMKSLVAVGI
ncbi:MAG: hypothetical protein LE178_02840 [Endomicrobium sp.]|nr:hypothetical protein [Endomicrobium sp.]